MNTPRNIIAIDRISVSSLTGFKRVSTESVKLRSDISWKKIPIKVPAKLTISDKMEDGVRMHTAQLVFRTCDHLVETDRWAYRCHTADGQKILIGSDGRPYPVGNVTTNHPDNMNDSQLEEVTVNWTSSHRIPRIIDE